MENFSLLYPKNSRRKENTLTDEAVNDLSLDFIIDALTEDNYEKNLLRKIMVHITDDRKTIEYRRDIFEDFLNFPELRKELSELLVKLEDLREIERFQKDQEASSLWSLINRLREIDEYVNCITNIKQLLEKLDIKSEGMLTLKKLVTDIHNESGFPEIKKDIEDMFSRAKQLRSITIGVNLDDLLRPKNAGVVALNNEEFKVSRLMYNFMKFKNHEDELHNGTDDVEDMKYFHPESGVRSGLTNMIIGSVQKGANQNVHIETSTLTGADPLSDALKKTVTEILRKTVNDIKSTLRKYINISGYTLVNLYPEIVFFIRFSQLVDKITAMGMPMCKPEILNPEGRDCSFKELYNLKLAINNVNGENIDIITNEFEFNSGKRIYILTGPNRGGKTIFTQAVGLCMLLAQWGIYIPASYAKISPCDNIYTHFPADENDTVDLGRLGEESKRLSQIFEVADKKSLLLLNESLATTNVSEGLFIAEDVVKAMKYLGTRAIFNTHMHELARDLDKINKSEGDGKVVSIITGVHDGKRSFKVTLAPPQGVSYAKDIAEKYGVTYDKIREKIDKNG